MKIRGLLKFVLLLIFFSIFVLGQEKKDAIKDKQVLLNVNVLNSENEVVKDLKKEHFRLYENNKPVEISYFSSENSPISAGILIDVSQSMEDGIDLCREGMLNFIEKSNPQNEYFTAAFSRKVNLLSDFANKDQTAKTVSASPYFSEKQKSGETVLFDAINFGIENLSKAKNQRKVLFIFWDNSDDYSSGKYKQLEKLVRERNITVYPIGCRRFDTPFSFNLDALAEISGGSPVNYGGGGLITYHSKNYTSKDFFMLKFVKLAEQFQNQYIIGFKPALENKDNKWRKLEMKLEIQKELRKQIGITSILYRNGYFPSSEVVTDSQF